MSSMVLGSLSFVRAIVLARLLTPEHFGLMATCLVVMRALQVFSETGLNAALIQRAGDVDEAKNTVYSMTAGRGILLAAIVFASSASIAEFYREPLLKELLDVMAIALAISGLGNINFVVLQKELNFRPQFYLQQTLALIDFTVTVALAWWLRSVWALVIGHLIKTLVSVPLSFLILGGKLRFGWQPQIAMELLRFGKFIGGTTIVVYVTTEIDNVVIGKVLGMELLGAYVLAYMLANLPATHLAKVIASVMFPAFSKLQQDRPALKNAYLETVRLVATLAIPAAVGIGVLANELVQVVFGPRWEVAANPLPVLCVFGALRSVTVINGYVFNAIGKPQISFYVNLVKLALIAILIVPATREFGLVGAAIAVTLPSLVMFAVSEFVFSRTLQIPMARILGAMGPAIVASAAMGIALAAGRRWISLDSPVTLTLAVLTSGAIYFAANQSDIRNAVRRLTSR